MSELKLEDLKVGDKLEFISEEIKQDYLDSFKGVNWDLVWNCFSEGVAVVKEITYDRIVLEYKEYSRLKFIYHRELKFFRKVESKGLGQFVDVTVTVGEQIPYVLVDADIKDYVESYTRQMAGERFMFGDKQMWFDSKDGNFMCDDKLVGIYKSEYRNFKIKKPWYDTVSEDNPVLCKGWGDEGKG